MNILITVAIELVPAFAAAFSRRSHTVSKVVMCSGRPIFLSQNVVETAEKRWSNSEVDFSQSVGTIGPDGGMYSVGVEMSLLVNRATSNCPEWAIQAARHCQSWQRSQ